mmetsp:Transcript_46008/g.109298  ORF Transcript_46008/g.109298 Transcript_46008/m.109298 type:complete len:241 (-) Transcript_46008:57-779(-)
MPASTSWVSFFGGSSTSFTGSALASSFCATRLGWRGGLGAAFTSSTFLTSGSSFFSLLAFTMTGLLEDSLLLLFFLSAGLRRLPRDLPEADRLRRRDPSRFFSSAFFFEALRFLDRLFSFFLFLDRLRSFFFFDLLLRDLLLFDRFLRSRSLFFSFSFSLSFFSFSFFFFFLTSEEDLDAEEAAFFLSLSFFFLSFFSLSSFFGSGSDSPFLAHSRASSSRSATPSSSIEPCLPVEAPAP